MKGAIEAAIERVEHGAREPGRVVLIAGHELDGGQPDSSGAGQLFASIDGVEMLAADHHTDALAYRARIRQLREQFDFDGAVARGRVSERGYSRGGQFAAHDARA